MIILTCEKVLSQCFHGHLCSVHVKLLNVKLLHERMMVNDELLNDWSKVRKIMERYRAQCTANNMRERSCTDRLIVLVYINLSSQ